MDNAREIISYLEALAQELVAMGIREQYHLLISGGAWLLIQSERRSTEDIDFALVIPPRRAAPKRLLQITLQRGGEIATRTSVTAFAEAVEAVARDIGLPIDWINDECAYYLYDSAPNVEAYYWRSFANVLYLYVPTDEYMFVTKLLAYRRKDVPDLRVLLRRLRIHTPEEAQLLLDRFLTEAEQEFSDAGKKLKRLFRA